MMGDLITGGVLAAIVAACIWWRRLDDRRQLIRDAEYEHRMLMRGDITGIYGRYPPPAETRGIGIWGIGDPQERRV